MNHAERCAAFKALHERRRCPFVIPNPWDAGSARILAGAGFKALATTSAGVAFGLGPPVDGMVNREEALANARAIVDGHAVCRCPPISRTATATIPPSLPPPWGWRSRPGSCGASVEDASWRSRRTRSTRSITPSHASKAAVRCRPRAFPHKFMVTARAESVSAWARRSGRGDPPSPARSRRSVLMSSMRRGCLISTAIKRRSPVRCRLPGERAGQSPALATNVAELGAAGVRRISLGGAVCRAALGALFRAAREMAEQGSFLFLNQAASISDINACMKAKN